MKKLAATLCIVGSVIALSACSTNATYQNQDRTEGGIAVIGGSDNNNNNNNNTAERTFTRAQHK